MHSILLSLLVFTYSLIPCGLMTCYLWLAWNCPHSLLMMLICVVVYNIICMELVPGYYGRRCKKTGAPKDHEWNPTLPLVDEILQRAKRKMKVRFLMSDKEE